MNHRNRLFSTLPWLACLGVLIPAPLFSATLCSNDANHTHDIALQHGGRLSGQVVDSTGVSLPNTPLTLLQGGTAVAQTNTDSAGRFSVAGLDGGVYEISVSGTRKAYRAWQPETGPPSARDSITVRVSPVVRGQQEAANTPIPSMGTLTAIGLSITALTLSIVLPLTINAS